MNRTARRTLAIAVSLIAPLAAQAPAAGGERTAKVLALLQRIPTSGAHLWSGQIEQTTNEYGCALIAQRLQGMCGTGWQPAFDPALARALARELCQVYGLEAAADAPAPGAIAARLDCLDAARGIGLKLRGAVGSKAIAGYATVPTVVDEPAATDLDVAEHRALAQANVRVHVADVRAFWDAASADHLTTTLCYLASVAAFLNGVTDGEDVDFGALLPLRWQRVSVDVPKASAGLGVERWLGGGGFTLTAERATEAVIAVDPARATHRETGERIAAIGNGGRPVTLEVTGLGAERGAFTVALRQCGRDGKERELARTTNEFLFAPGTFDASKPFALVLSLRPGQYRCTDSVSVAAPAAPRDH